MIEDENFLRIGDHVEYLGFKWMVYNHPQMKTRKDGRTFEAVTLVKLPWGFHDIVYPRRKMCGVYVSKVRKLPR